MIFIGPNSDYVIETLDWNVKNGQIRIHQSMYDLKEEDFVGIINAVKNGNKFYQFKHKVL